EAQMGFWNSLFGRGPLFLCGIAAAAVYGKFGPSLRTALASVPAVRWGGADAMLIVTLIAIGLLLQWTVTMGNGRFASINQWWHRADGLGWAVVLLLLLVAPLRLAPLLSNRVLSLLGVLSYSIYLLHAPFMMIPIQAFVGPRAWTPWAWTLVSML